MRSKNTNFPTFDRCNGIIYGHGLCIEDSVQTGCAIFPQPRWSSRSRQTKGRFPWKECLGISRYSTSERSGKACSGQSLPFRTSRGSGHVEGDGVNSAFIASCSFWSIVSASCRRFTYGPSYLTRILFKCLESQRILTRRSP